MVRAILTLVVVAAAFAGAALLDFRRDVARGYALLLGASVLLVLLPNLLRVPPDRSRAAASGSSCGWSAGSR